MEFNISVLNIPWLNRKKATFEENSTMLFRHKVFFWVAVSLLLFGLFRWLFGVALPEVALQFALGTTFILVSGLFLGNILTKLSIRTNAIQHFQKVIVLTSAFVVFGFIAVAFLLNAMIEKTTLFPFAMTVLILFLVSAAVGCLITCIRHQYKTRIMSAQAAMAQSKSELQLLQSRLSPHFLFNTLNNLYGLSIHEPQKLPPLLLKLSELLRYSVYDVKEMFVPIQNEVAYIRNYVGFEHLRLGDKLQLNLDIDPGLDLSRCKIPPLMLIVFVENAFKHSRAAGDEMIRIDIALFKRENQVVFSAHNSVAALKTEPLQEKRSGFGLDSVRKRLNALYEGRHKLTIQKTESDYTVSLELQCQ